MKRNGIFQSQTRWQNGHYQSVSGGTPPHPIDYGLVFVWNNYSVNLEVSRIELLNDSHFTTDLGELYYSRHLARNLTGLNSNFDRITPNVDIFPKTGSQASYNHTYTMCFNNLGVLPSYTGTHPLYIGVYWVTFTLRTESAFTPIVETYPFTNEYNISPCFLFDNFQPPTSSSTGSTCLRIIAFDPNLTPLTTPQPYSFNLKDIIGYFGVFKLSQSDQLHIFNCLLDTNYDPFQAAVNNIYPMTSPATYGGLSELIFNAYQNEPPYNNYYSLWPLNTCAALPRSQFFQRSSSSGGGAIAANRWQFDFTLNNICMDSLYKVFVVRQTPTKFGQPLIYTMYQFVLWDSYSKKIVGEVVR